MSITKTKTISLYELETTYRGDLTNLYLQILDQFRFEHQDLMIEAESESFLDEDLQEITLRITITF